MRKNIRSIVAAVCFCLVVILGFLYFRRIYCFKHVDGIYGLQIFYEQEENINDVIFVGSSHIFEGVNTQVLWEEYGIASFDLAGSIQPMWNSYYYIKEALKTQNPRLIVLDLFGVLQTEDYIDTSRIIKNTYGMRCSADKIEAVKTSAPSEQWTNYLWEFPTYHMRYAELESSDFLPYQGIANWEAWKGFLMNTETVKYETPEGFQTDEKGELTEKVEEYVRKICQLCKEGRVPLLLIKTPNYTDKEATIKYNRAAEIAEEYGVPFLNFNYYYDEMGLDFSTDMADISHLNYRGNPKFTRYLAEYIKGHYKIPDRRGEKGYESYDIISRDCTMRLQNALLQDTEELEVFLEEIQNENYVIVYSVSGDYKKISNYENIRKKFASYGMNLDTVEGSSVWVMQEGNLLFSSDNQKEYSWHMELAPYKNLQIKSPQEQSEVPQISYNRTSQILVGSGVNIIVYDTVTEELADTVGMAVGEEVLQHK